MFSCFENTVLKLRAMVATHKIVGIILAIIAGGGFFLARHIFVKKRRKEKIVCLLDSKCDEVVHSQYSTFLGVPIEIFGMIYFAFIGIFFISTLLIAELDSIYLALFILITTFGAFVFSIYLSTIQLFIIKQYCSWCLISSILCTVEFVVVVTSSPLNIKALLSAVLNV